MDAKIRKSLSSLIILSFFLAAPAAFAQTNCFNFPTWTPDAFWGNRGTFFVDINGDAVDDVIVVNDETISGACIVVRFGVSGTFPYPNAPTTHFDPTHHYVSLPGDVFYGDKATFVVDVTGDGFADVVAVKSAQVFVRRNSHNFPFQPTFPFPTNEPWTTGPYYGERGTFIADVDNDGRADLIAVNNAGVQVRRSNGYAFATSENWITVPFYGSLVTAFADVTGDGRADAIAVNTDGIYVRRSNGSTFLPNEFWSSTFNGPGGRTWFADVSGDNKADVIISSGDVYMKRSTGSAFSSTTETWLRSQESPTYGDIMTGFARLYGGIRGIVMVPSSTPIIGRINTIGAGNPPGGDRFYCVPTPP